MKSLVLILLVIYSVDCNDLFKSVKGTACLVTISPKLTSDCVHDFNKEYDSRPKDEKQSKATCCAYLQLQSCVLSIAEKECGEEGKEVSKSFLSSINRGITSDDCVDYGFISCITITQWAIFGAIALVLLALLSCICCCCCR